jgi:DNA-binding protein H-NS
MDLRKLSPAQLQQLIDKATRRREEITTKRVDRVRARIDAILKAEGMTLAEVYGGEAIAGTSPAPKAARGKAGRKAAPTGKKSSTRGQPVAPKYRNPDNPSQTWAGRGLKPRWMTDALAAGRRLDDFLIR